MKKNEEILCICNNKYELNKFDKHYKECLLFKNKFSEFDSKINILLKKYSNNEKELTLVIYLFKSYISLMELKLQKLRKENIKNIEINNKINKKENKSEIKQENNKLEIKQEINKIESNKSEIPEINKPEIRDNNENKSNKNNINNINNKNNILMQSSYENEFYIKQLHNILGKDEIIKDNERRNIIDKQKSKLYDNNTNMIGNFLINYSQGQIKGDDDNPAVLPNYKRRTIEEIRSKHIILLEKQKKSFKKWRNDDKLLQNLKIINPDKYNPIGLNMDINLKEILINQLVINTIHEKQYIILRIISQIIIYNYIIFLGEDKNKEIIPVSIYDADKYYSLDIDNWDKTQEFYNIGKYIIIINPNYIIYGDIMYETEGIDGLVCQSPNETILFEDEIELNTFINLLKNNNFESLKQLGDLMTIKKCYEKSIYYYEKALNINNNHILVKSKILSNLSENYIQYKYFTKGLEYINKAFDAINNCIANNIDEIEQKFIIKLFLRKLRCFIGLRNFKEAHDLLAKIQKDKDLKTFYKIE